MNQGPINTSRARLGNALAGAVQLWQAGRLGEADEALQGILRQWPEHGDALHLSGIIAHQRGKTDAGIALIERALAANPTSSPFHASVAKLHRVAGHFDRAIVHGERAIELKSDNADALLNLGLAYLDNGAAEKAIVRFDAALRLRPQLAEAVNGRGTALKMLGRPDEALAEYRRALAITPSYPEALNNLGTVLRQQGRASEAEAAFRSALALRPAYLLARNNLVLALRDLKQYDAAIAVAHETLRAAPQNADALAYLGAIHLDLGRTEAALEALRGALAINPDKAETHNTLGRALMDAGRTAAAIDAYRKAIALNPTFSDPHNNLGNALRDTGDFSGALGEYEAALKLDPAFIGVYCNIAEVKKFASNADAHLGAMEAAAGQIDALPVDAQARLHFALGKAYDDLGRYGEAFEHLAKGNALHRKANAYDERERLRLFESVEAVFSRELVAAKEGGGFLGGRPIFVIGMPRSGTTLVEQIIAGHHEVQSAGETRDLDETMAVLPRYPELMPALGPVELTRIGEAYMQRLAQRAPGAARIIDKLPTNFHYLGLIHLALPNAKVVHVSRNAIDTCLSCYSKMFTIGQDHTYDLGELGRYYRAYERLMEHWRKVLPDGAFIDIQYEKLVGDIEGEAKRLFAFLGLEWEAQVLAFHTTKERVRTASAYQVRQPLYSTAIARWRNYEQFLRPLIKEVGAP